MNIKICQLELPAVAAALCMAAFSCGDSRVNRHEPTGDSDSSRGDAAGGSDSDPGPCGVNCDLAVPHGTGTCDTTSTPPVCVVDACDDGFVQLSATVCASPPDLSCKPCSIDADCLGGSCTMLESVNVCVSPCGAGNTCPNGYGCIEIDAGVERCVPTNGSCTCNSTNAGHTRACQVDNRFGTCFGLETCDAFDGWTGCTAAAPEEEQCDGSDNDCNGIVDDGVTAPPTPCETTSGFGTCTGSWSCAASSGWLCSAATPAAEACDYEDNNCNGEIDEDFKDGDGYLVHDDHCGACNHSCIGAIPNGSAFCAANSGSPRCEVETCSIGYEEVGPTSCLAASGTLCSPCVGIDDCLVTGDACVTLSEGNFCGRDCSAGNAHDLPAGECPIGFTCTDLGAGIEQCIPNSGACSCQPTNQDELRPCAVTNAHGTCEGEERCDGSTGWIECTAPIPEAEVCDGIDNDCNRLIDDALPDPGPCERTNEFGTCSGPQSCGGVLSWQCNAAVPEAETCDHGDNDCDDGIDEDFANLYEGCSAGIGACERFGYYECRGDGAGTECNAVAGTGGAEVCNDLDDDCNTHIDDGGTWNDKGTRCTVGVGACETAGIRICDPSDPTGPTVCSASAGMDTPETCNGIDDDCNGVPDDNLTDTELCTEQDGVCAGSLRACAGAAGYLPCTAARYGTLFEPSEMSCDGHDNDCDGSVDNGLPPIPCANQNGVCAGSTAPCEGMSGPGGCGPAEYGADYETPDETRCDLLDNDCDGQTDENFKDTQGTGTYDMDTACGNCFSDCTTIFARAHAYGRCNATGPMCEMICCTASDTHPTCNGNDHYDLNGIVDDGCEFEPDADAVYVATPTHGGDDIGGCGGFDTPCETITFALGVASAGPSDKVLVANGVYDENVDLADGIDLLGGYDPVTWERNVASTTTVIRGQDVGSDHKSINAVGITTATRFGGFFVLAANASTPHVNSYGIYVRDSNANLLIESNVIYAGAGAPGAAGDHGISGMAGVDGDSGGATYNTNCFPAGAFERAGGDGGWRQCQNPETFPSSVPDTFTDVSGGDGGSSVCPARGIQEGSGQNGANGGGSGGPGGWGHNSTETGSCSPTAGELEVGTPGATPSPTFIDGTGGSGCASPTGELVSSEWRGFAGGHGSHGLHGAGGGGGGAGGGQVLTTGVDDEDIGGSGGGGGSGGCAAERGSGGNSGGGSFGIFVSFSSANLPAGVGDIPTITDNTIYRGMGGTGGNGGSGGAGGSGGFGASGGPLGSYNGPVYCIFPGAPGGSGSRGGHGGGGGGGCGGSSWDIVVWNLNFVGHTYDATNSFPIMDATDTAGSGGAGGVALGSGGGGEAGGFGGFGNVLVVN